MIDARPGRLPDENQGESSSKERKEHPALCAIRLYSSRILVMEVTLDVTAQGVAAATDRGHTPTI